MLLAQVESAITATPKGANIILEWVRDLKTRKGVTDNLTKSVRMVGRVGMDYNHLGAVQEKRESGELPAEPQPLPWGTWAKFPYLIEHKGGFYLRLYKGTSEKVHPECHFFRNGVEVSKEEIAPSLLKSELEERDGDCFTCKVENMTKIHNENEWVTLIIGQIGQEKVIVESPIPAKTLATMQV
jgi:hypothetical protein